MHCNCGRALVSFLVATTVFGFLLTLFCVKTRLPLWYIMNYNSLQIHCYLNTYFRLHVCLSSLPYVQLRAKQTARLHFFYTNEVTLRGQNPPLKCCQPLDFLYNSLKRLALSILQIKGLQVKGLQSYRSSKF